jgi:hypothetical protein
VARNAADPDAVHRGPGALPVRVPDAVHARPELSRAHSVQPRRAAAEQEPRRDGSALPPVLAAALAVWAALPGESQEGRLQAARVARRAEVQAVVAVPRAAVREGRLRVVAAVPPAEQPEAAAA